MAYPSRSPSTDHTRTNRGEHRVCLVLLLHFRSQIFPRKSLYCSGLGRPTSDLDEFIGLVCRVGEYPAQFLSTVDSAHRFLPLGHGPASHRFRWSRRLPPVDPTADPRRQGREQSVEHAIVSSLEAFMQSAYCPSPESSETTTRKSSSTSGSHVRELLLFSFFSLNPRSARKAEIGRASCRARVSSPV